MFFSPWLPGNFDGCSADGDEVMDRLPDGSTDDLMIYGHEGISLGIALSGNFVQQYSWVF